MKRKKERTKFGVELSVFAARTGLTLKEVAEKSGVKYTTLIETSTGRCAGHELIPKVEKFMQEWSGEKGRTEP